MSIQAAEIYLTNARENSPMDGRNIEDMVFSGNLSHKETIARYFKFISYLLMKFEGHNKLTNEHIDFMFKVFVKDSISKVERESFYKFFTFDEFDISNLENKRIANTKSREYLFKNILCKELNSINTGTSEFECFETNFFTVNLAKKNLKREQNEQVFRTISMELDGLDLVWDFSIFSPDEKIRKQCNEFLGDLYLYNEKENFKKRGENNSTFFEAWLEKILTIDESNKQAIANILRLLFSFVRRYDGHHMDTESFEKYDYDLTVDYQDHQKDKPKTRLMKVNKEMTIGAIRKRIGDFYNIIPSEILIISSRSYLSECCMNDKLSAYRECKNINVRRRVNEEKEFELPRYLAASNLQVIQQVIEKGLESENHSLRCEALQFFEYIPTNIDRREKMIKCKKLAKKNDVESWLDFLYSKSIEKQGLYYGLKVMHSILESSEKYMTKKETDDFIETKRSFIKKFNELEGFPLLVETLNSLNLENLMKDVVWVSIFQILVRILELLIQENDSSKNAGANQKSKKDEFLKATSKLVLRLTEVLSIIAKNVTLDRDLSLYLFTPEEVKTVSEDKIKNIKDEYEILETDFYTYLIKLLKDCLFINPEEIKLFYSSDFIKDGLIINLLALHPNHNTMKKFAESMRDFCWSLKVCKDIIISPVTFFIEMFSKEIKTVISYGVLEYTEFFNLWDQLIRLLNQKDLTKENFSVADVGKIELLYQTIVTRTIIEDDVKQDSILSGWLKMLTTFDELFGSASIKANCPSMYSQEFLNYLMSVCLFSREKPDVEMQDIQATDSNVDDISYPLCKHNETRKNAFKLVNQIFGESNMVDVARYLEPYIKTGSWRTNKREKWHIQQSKLSQRNTHVGLVNLGCTCYMNSLMQQLFMCPQFRNFICTSKDPKKDIIPLEDNVLYHSKYLFANLIKSKMPSYNPVVFFNSIKDFNGEPMPTNEQRDVDEFLNIYMDKIEQNIIGTADDKHLKSIFGGAFAQELICKGCPHRSTREEPYLALSLEIKNKTNIIEALDLFIQGEMLEGDNAYYCERCDKKVDTLKRGCIKKLPNALIISLKRFEFDLETLSRYKLNSYCEFYDDLDMRDYCQETLAKKELLKTMNDEKLTYEMLTEDQKATHDFNLPDNYYKYKLKGVVVHYGTADGGHYYSYIKERGTDKWYEFNDTNVREYDPADLPEDTFGGKLKHEIKTVQNGKTKIESERLHSAYVLIYERNEFVDNEKLYELRETNQANLQSLAKNYGFDARLFKLESEILADLTLASDKHWISNKMFDDYFMESVVDM